MCCGYSAGEKGSEDRNIPAETNALSKKLENLEHPIVLHFFVYNFITRHMTLRMPPALKAHVTDHVWTLDQGTAGRYSPGQVLAIDRWTVIGSPDEDRICTSHCERQNKTLRMQIRRCYTGLTDGHGKRWRNHEAAVALFVAYFNYCRVHGTLETTPAVAAGIRDHVWSVTCESFAERVAHGTRPPLS